LRAPCLHRELPIAFFIPSRGKKDYGQSIYQGFVSTRYYRY